MTADTLVLLFLFFSLSMAIVIKQLQKVFSFIPYTPTLFIVSILFGKFNEYLGPVGASIRSTAEIDPRGILLIFLPPLIFESSFNSDWYVFRKQSAQIGILAFPSVLVGALIIMFCIKVVIGYDDSYYTFIQAFMFGSILSCTDTVAVLALLKEAGAPKKFSSLIEGESLLNDGSCMILFTISLELAKGGTMSILQIVFLFLQLTVGAVVLGVVFGFTATQLIKLSKSNALLCFNITLVGCYLLYFTAEYVHFGIHVSGIMALVAMGLYMAAFGRTKFSVDARSGVHHIWKVFVFIAETVIFILGGVIVGTKSLSNPQLLDLVGTKELIGLGILYLCMTAARFLSIGVFMIKLKKLGYGLRWAEVVALTYGGLRGAVGIAFTLILASNPLLPLKFRSICIFNMVGCAFLTLVINAPTCSSVIIALGLCKKSEIKVRLFKNFMRQCVTGLNNNLKEVESNPYLSRANWDKAASLAGLQQLTAQLSTKESLYTDKENVSMHRELLSERESEYDQGLMQEVRNRFNVALKSIFWRKFENNECSDLTLRKLTESVDLDLDGCNHALRSWDYLISEQQSKVFFLFTSWLKQFPLCSNFAHSLTFSRVNSLYELVSTYIEGMSQCEEECRTKLLIETGVLRALSQEALHQRTLAQHFLDNEIRSSHPEIMAKVQTGKVSQEILTYLLRLLKEHYETGLLDQQFYHKLRSHVDECADQLQNVTVNTNDPTPDIILTHPFFNKAPPEVLTLLQAQCEEKRYGKDQPIAKSYEQSHYLYFIAKGQVREEWRLPHNTFYKRISHQHQFVCLAQLLTKQSDIQYSATANSVLLLYAFPSSTLRRILLDHPQLEALLYMEILPFVSYINPAIEIKSLSLNTWNRIRPNTTFLKIPKGKKSTTNKNYLILLQGKIIINKTAFGPGFFALQEQAQIVGAAKYYQTDVKLEEQVDRMSSKNIKFVVDMGSLQNKEQLLRRS